MPSINLMAGQGFKLYGYRWVVLGGFMFINLPIQMLWIAYAPITGPAAQFYGVADLQIGLLAMTFMIAFIPLAIPVAWAIDTYGFRRTVSVGAIMMGFFGVARGLAGANYAWVLISTIGLAISQPLLLVAWTKVPAQWFPVEERATAVGLVTLANLVGTALGMLLTPILIKSISIPTVQLLYGSLAASSAVVLPGLCAGASTHTARTTRAPSARAHAGWAEARFQGQGLSAVSGGVLHWIRVVQRSQHVGRKYHSAAWFRTDRCRNPRCGDVGGGPRRCGNYSTFFRQGTQAKEVLAVGYRAVDTGTHRPDVRHIVLVAAGVGFRLRVLLDQH